EVGESFANYAVVATREAEQRAELATTADVLVSVPILDVPVNDLGSLVRLGQYCWRGAGPGRADSRPVATFSDLARQHTDLERADVAHLLRLVADWGMLADFCFADL